jgi:hypothetical protein
MEFNININRKSRSAYFPKEIINAGFCGKITVFTSTYAVILAHPDATLQDIEKSLRLFLEEIQLREKSERNE